MDNNAIRPITFTDVAESNGWLSSDLDAVTAVADGPVGEGFWNCCIDRPAMAVAFDDDNGNQVWRKACRSCASTVPADRLAHLPTETPAVPAVRYDALNPAPYAAHKTHPMNLSGTHRGNRYCLVCSVPVGMPTV